MLFVNAFLCAEMCVLERKRERGSSTFRRAIVWVVVGVGAIKVVTVGQTAGVDMAVVGLALISCWRG